MPTRQQSVSKLIFLDIDGVLNTQEYQQAWRAKGLPSSDEFSAVFDPRAVAQLKHIIEQTEADIVLISSWKFLGIEVLRQMWTQRELPGRLLDITPSSASDETLLAMDLELEDLLNTCKGTEIEAWLRQHSNPNVGYVIIDDEEVILPTQRAYFVQIKSEVGLSEQDTERAIHILLSKLTPP